MNNQQTPNSGTWNPYWLATSAVDLGYSPTWTVGGYRAEMILPTKKREPLPPPEPSPDPRPPHEEPYRRYT